MKFRFLKQAMICFPGFSFYIRRDINKSVFLPICTGAQQNVKRRNWQLWKKRLAFFYFWGNLQSDIDFEMVLRSGVECVISGLCGLFRAPLLRGAFCLVVSRFHLSHDEKLNKGVIWRKKFAIFLLCIHCSIIVFFIKNVNRSPRRGTGFLW